MTVVEGRAVPPPRTATPGEGQPGAAPAAPPKVKDKRVTALVRFAMSITALNVVGIAWLGFEQAPVTPLACLAVGYVSATVFEAVDAWAWGRRPEFAGGRRAWFVFLLPPHISALACSMLLYGNASLWPYLFAVVVATGSKYVVRVRVNGRLKHVLNPSNAGIAAALLVFRWVAPTPMYQFTNNYHVVVPWLVPVVILTLGTMLNSKLTGKVPLILAWVGGFVGQALVRWLLHGEPLPVLLLPLSGVAFVLFTNYMITDPGTTPFTRHGQVVFGLTTAVAYSALVWNGINYGLFFALTMTCALRGAVLVLTPVTQRAVARLPEPARSRVGRFPLTRRLVVT